MFLKTGQLKKMMKDSLKRSDLYVGNVDNHYLVYSGSFGVYIDEVYASNKLKAAITELVGDLPASEECYLYMIAEDGKVTQTRIYEYPDPFEDWKEAKEAATATPVSLYSNAHEMFLFQGKNDLRFMAVRRCLTIDMFSVRELDENVEHFPKYPSIRNGCVLYWKSETTIYWVGTDVLGERVREILFSHLKGMDFFESDWIEKRRPEEEGTDSKAADSQLPY